MIDLSLARGMVWSEPCEVAKAIAIVLLGSFFAGCAPPTPAVSTKSARPQAGSTSGSAEVSSMDTTIANSDMLPSQNAIETGAASPTDLSQVSNGRSDSMPSLIVEATGARSREGHYAFAVFANREDFAARSNPVVTGRIAADADSVIWDAGPLPFGEYAIAVYHDANNNQQLDRHAFGYPLEAYGFSRDVRGKLGPPDFRDAAFKIDNESLRMRIQIK